jgi:hypothetical protein
MEYYPSNLQLSRTSRRQTIHRIKSREGARGERSYSSYSFSTSALDEDKWSASRPGRALAPDKQPPVPILQEAGWAPEPVWTQWLQEKLFRLYRGLNVDRPVVQPVARHYTDWATRLTFTELFPW